MFLLFIKFLHFKNLGLGEGKSGVAHNVNIGIVSSFLTSLEGQIINCWVALFFRIPNTGKKFEMVSYEGETAFVDKFWIASFKCSMLFRMSARDGVEVASQVLSGILPWVF